MELYKNGYVAATLNTKNRAYRAWPLAELTEDKTAESFTEAADEKWFCKYDMQAILPDLSFARRYLNYCIRIGIPAVLLLFESSDHTFVVDDEVKVKEVLGFDCIGSVYYSYLQSESGFIHTNEHGLADCMEDVLEFIRIRKAEIESGANLEDFWEETPVRISIIE